MKERKAAVGCGKFKDGCAYALWPLRRFCNARLLRARRPQPLVRAALCFVVCSRLCLWVPARSLALRTG